MTMQAESAVQAADPGDRWRPSRQERMALARQTSWLLQSLGDEPGKVAGSLSAAGVLGLPADARQCALAMYLRAVMQADPRVASVRVFHDRVVVGAPGRFRQRRVLVPLTAAARGFVAGFDAHRFPSLVRSRRAPAPTRPPAPTTSGGAT